MVREYRFRIADNIIQSYLSSSGAVLIEGPKWCQKTWTGIHHEEHFNGAGSSQASQFTKCKYQPSLLLAEKHLGLLTSMGCPELWDAVRFEVDQRGETGQFILTGLLFLLMEL